MPRHLTARLSAALMLAASPPALAASSTELVSLGSRGQQGNEVSFRGGLSADGSIVAFTSYATNLVQPDANGTATDILVRNRRAGKTRRADVSSAGAQANASSDDPFVSRSGRFVSFGSLATNLVAGDGNG